MQRRGEHDSEEARTEEKHPGGVLLLMYLPLSNLIMAEDILDMSYSLLKYSECVLNAHDHEYIHFHFRI